MNIEDFKVAQNTVLRSQSQNGGGRLQRMKASMGVSRFGSRAGSSNERVARAPSTEVRKTEVR